MILVDSSAWIEYFRRGEEEEVRDLVFSAIRDHRAATMSSSPRSLPAGTSFGRIPANTYRFDEDALRFIG